MKLLILGGGNSPERDVSLRSSKTVAAAAVQAGYEIQKADPAEGLKFLDKVPKDTIVFPILHGVGGEDGSLQKQLEKLNLPFLGADSQVSANCFDKWKTRQILQNANIPMAQAELVSPETYAIHLLARKPHVLKIVHGGSSIGTLIVRNPAAIDQKQVEAIFKLEKTAVLEELVEGIEITVPILDQKALPAIEVHPPLNGDFDYANKYNGKSQELCPPPSLSDNQHKSSQILAEQVHKAMNCRHLSRVDTIMRPDGSFVVLEINTIPGLTDQSLYPKAAAVAGLPMPKLIKKFVSLVERDFGL